MVNGIALVGSNVRHLDNQIYYTVRYSLVTSHRSRTYFYCFLVLNSRLKPLKFPPCAGWRLLAGGDGQRRAPGGVAIRRDRLQLAALPRDVLLGTPIHGAGRPPLYTQHGGRHVRVIS